MRIPILLVPMVCYLPASYAQSSSVAIGAPSAGMAFASACLSDEWAIFSNPAGVDGIDRVTFGLTRELHPQMRSFDRSALTFGFPAAGGVMALGVFRFGDELYSEQIVSAGFANTFGIASLGARLSYIQYRAEGFGSHGVLTAGFGGIARLTKTLSIGAYVTNINQPSITTGSEEQKIPTRLAAGIGMKPSSQIFLAVEVEKDLDHPLSLRSGIEYQLRKGAFFRCGFSSTPRAMYGGLGFRPRRLGMDYGVAYDFYLGISHSLSVRYTLTRK